MNWNVDFMRQVVDGALRQVNSSRALTLNRGAMDYQRAYRDVQSRCNGDMPDVVLDSVPVLNLEDLKKAARKAQGV